MEPTTLSTPAGLAAHYRNLFREQPIDRQLESTGNTPHLDRQRQELIVEQSRARIYQLIEERGEGPARELKAQADKILTEGTAALAAITANNEAYLSPQASVSLEVIVQESGIRPSFLIRSGQVDRSTGQVGSWGDYLDMSQPTLMHTIACVGRIDRQGTHMGTGFLIGPDLIVTNRHVLEALGRVGVGGNFELDPTVTIDFGYEYQGQSHYNRRMIKDVVFKGPLDLVLLALDTTSTPATLPVQPLHIERHPYRPNASAPVYVIGYPADPGLRGLELYGEALASLFRSTYGYKRLAPGRLIQPGVSGALQFSHDATTLWGSSGSPVVLFLRESIALGLHFGGTLRSPRKNDGYVLGNCLAIKDDQTGRTLEECLDAYQVIIC